MKKRIINKYSLTVIFIFLLIILDQIIKALVINHMKSVELDTIVIIDKVLNFTYVQNTGGAFGIGSGSIGMYIITNIIVLGTIIRFLILQRERIDTKTNIILSAILAGGFSNLIDRIFRGFVLDFIDISPLFSFPKFNLADMYIVSGWVVFAGIMAVYTAKEIHERKMKKEQKKEV